MTMFLVEGLGTVESLYRQLVATNRFYDYEPQHVTWKSLRKWLQQYDRKDQRSLLLLLDYVIYYSRKDTAELLVRLNDDLLLRLAAAGVSPKHVIYVQIHEAGSSSPLMLSMLRDCGHLERKGCRRVDWKDVQELHNLAVRLGFGAIVYVDDFAASGHQFLEVRERLYENIPLAFSEFFLLPCICVEARDKIEKEGVEVIAGHVHGQSERPLHPENSGFDATTRARLVELCGQVDPKAPLGYQDMATMVVYYRNAPNTIPVVLRGNHTRKKLGVFPRTNDLDGRSGP
jgi:hypothetical protein